MITLKYLEENVPDLIDKESVLQERGVTMINIPHGRIKIMPEHRRPRYKKEESNK